MTKGVFAISILVVRVTILMWSVYTRVILGLRVTKIYIAMTRGVFAISILVVKVTISMCSVDKRVILGLRVTISI